MPVGRHLGSLAAQHVKRSTIELGGHAPFIVADDVDVVKVAAMAVALKFPNAGQVCASPTRFIVHEKVFDQFVEDFVARSAALKVGSGLSPDSQMGPLAHGRRPDAVEAFVQDAREKGAIVHTGGRCRGNQGYFYAPTVLTHVPLGARIMNDRALRTCGGDQSGLLAR